MNTSCNARADSNVIVFYFTFGCLLTILGTILNLCSCLLFCRAKSLLNTPYSVFIIALSIADIVKLSAEYTVHLLFLYIQHPYFVCSVTWFLTMTSENSSYAFLCALGKVCMYTPSRSIFRKRYFRWHQYWKRVTLNESCDKVVVERRVSDVVDN